MHGVDTIAPLRSDDLRRFLSTYRLELWLFFGIPAIVGSVHYLVTWFVQFDSQTGLYWSRLAISTLGFVLLAAAYPFVRRQGRQLLVLLWTLELVTQGASVVLRGLDLARGGLPAGIQLFTIHTFGDLHYYSTVSAWVGVIALVWFARQASRISTAHAFLLVGLSLATSSFYLEPFVLPPPSGYAGLFAGVYLVSAIALNILALWTIVHFESKGFPFRRNAVVALLGMALWRSLFGIYAYFPVLALSLGYRHLEPLFEDLSALGVEMLGHAMASGLYYLLPLPLIYFVRVRRRASDGLAATSEES